MGRGYSVSLRAGRSRDRVPVWTIFYTHFHTSPEEHTATCAMISLSFPAIKRKGRGISHPPASGADVEETVELCLHFPSVPLCSVLWWFILSSLYINVLFVPEGKHSMLRFERPVPVFWANSTKHMNELCW